jgi:hypothetical protein
MPGKIPRSKPAERVVSGTVRLTSDGIGVGNSRTEICQILGLSFSRISYLGRLIAHAQSARIV